MASINQKYAYIVLTLSGSFISKIIEAWTKAPYSHVSISLDKELNEMYSFARLKPYNPFIGGFVKEGKSFGTFKRFYKTTTEVIELPITNEQYNSINSMINNMYQERKKYHFNYLGLLFAGINKIYKKKDRYYCAEFVKNVLNNANINNDLPIPPKPMDFKTLPGKTIYIGKLKTYTYPINNVLE